MGTDPNGDAVCSNRVCSIKCDDSCFFSSFHKTCQPSTPSACGVSGTSCPSPPLFGKATCNNGVCGVQCSGSTVYNAQTKTCDIPSTKTQCGLWGDNCPDPANGDGYCYFGTCAVNCDAGYTLDSESNLHQGGRLSHQVPSWLARHLQVLRELQHKVRRLQQRCSELWLERMRLDLQCRLQVQRLSHQQLQLPQLPPRRRQQLRWQLRRRSREQRVLRLEGTEVRRPGQ